MSLEAVGVAVCALILVSGVVAVWLASGATFGYNRKTD